MLTRRRFVVGLGGAAVLSACQPRSKDVIRIGGVLPLTGDAAPFGVNAERGARLAIAQANATAPRQFLWHIEDSQGVPTNAATAARKLIDVDGVSALLGDVTSSGTQALIPIIDRAAIPLISPSASDPTLSGVSKFFARVWPSDLYEAEIIARFSATQGYTRVAVVYLNNDYGVGMIGAFENAVGASALKFKSGYDEDFSNFRPLISRMQQETIEAVFLVAFPEKAVLFMNQMDEAGLSIPVLATATIEDPSTASLSNAAQIVFASPIPPPDNTSKRQLFVNAYQEAYGEGPGVLSDAGFDCGRLLTDAYTEVGSDPVAVMAHIISRKNFDGVSGQMSFDANGDVIKDYGLKRRTAEGFNWIDG